MPEPREVAVTMPYKVFSEVVDLLQLLVVLDIKLYVRGIQPDKVRLSTAFDLMCEASGKAWDQE
jgi:hypothetical protein